MATTTAPPLYKSDRSDLISDQWVIMAPTLPTAQPVVALTVPTEAHFLMPASTRTPLRKATLR
ncbi:MAG: hypothetical protein KME27_12635 [Lyngbya sp. HA4199-MV5]|nr:hypothetical protein [Lyngbya sp. HA4199-MV5]